MSTKRSATDEPTALVREALTALELDDPERAFWRLIDAAGLIRRDCFINPMGIGTKDQPTGRGFFLGMTSMRAIDPDCEN